MQLAYQDGRDSRAALTVELLIWLCSTTKSNREKYSGSEMSEMSFLHRRSGETSYQLCAPETYHRPSRPPIKAPGPTIRFAQARIISMGAIKTSLRPMNGS